MRLQDIFIYFLGFNLSMGEFEEMKGCLLLHEKTNQTDQTNKTARSIALSDGISYPPPPFPSSLFVRRATQ